MRKLGRVAWGVPLSAVSAAGRLRGPIWPRLMATPRVLEWEMEGEMEYDGLDEPEGLVVQVIESATVREVVTEIRNGT